MKYITYPLLGAVLIISSPLWLSFLGLYMLGDCAQTMVRTLWESRHD